MNTLKEALTELKSLSTEDRLWADGTWRSAARAVLELVDPDAVVPLSATRHADFEKVREFILANSRGTDPGRHVALDALHRLAPEPGAETQGKPLDVKAPMGEAPDTVVFGRPNDWKLLGKTSSKAQGWMHSTRAMEVPGGVLVQTVSQVGAALSQALVVVRGADLVQVAGNHYELRAARPARAIPPDVGTIVPDPTQAELDADLLERARELIWPNGNYDADEDPGLLPRLKHLLDPREQ